MEGQFASNRLLMVSQGRAYSTWSKLDPPLDDQEECPMALEPMATYDLPFAPGVTYVEAEPHLRKITLACGHSFSAMGIVYYFCKKHMTCPLCRQGNQEARMDIGLLPSHIREIMQQHIISQWQEERSDEERENLDNLVSILLQELEQTSGMPLSSMSGMRNARSYGHRVVMMMYCYTQDSLMVPLLSLELEVIWQAHTDFITVKMPNHALRKLSNDLRMVPHITVVEFAVGIRIQDHEFIYLDRTDRLCLSHISQVSGTRTYHGRGVARFEMDVRKERGSTSFLEWKWIISTENFTGLIQETPIHLLLLQ